VARSQVSGLRRRLPKKMDTRWEPPTGGYAGPLPRNSSKLPLRDDEEIPKEYCQGQFRRPALTSPMKTKYRSIRHLIDHATLLTARATNIVSTPTVVNDHLQAALRHLHQAFLGGDGQPVESAVVTAQWTIRAAAISAAGGIEDEKEKSGAMAAALFGPLPALLPLLKTHEAEIAATLLEATRHNGTGQSA
jgi:hypothetical protein